jgi:hypothetical protein
MSAIDVTSHEIKIPSNEHQQKTYFQHPTDSSHIMTQMCFMLCTTFKHISFTTFVAEIGVPREIHKPVASH